MRFGLITPVFDGCLGSLELLHRDIARQTHEDWVWILCGNQFSEKMCKFVTNKKKLDGKNRISYLLVNSKDETNIFCKIANIAERRDICIKWVNADYIFILNADSKILDDHMFQRINMELGKNPKSICIYKIRHNVGVLPKFPITHGRIDSLNFCVKTSLAREVGYPSAIDFQMPSTDWWFFKRIYEATRGDYLFLDEIFCEHNGNNRYRNILTMYSQNKIFGENLLYYAVYCIRRNRPIQLIRTLVGQALILARAHRTQTRGEHRTEN